MDSKILGVRAQISLIFSENYDLTPVFSDKGIQTCQTNQSI